MNHTNYILLDHLLGAFLEHTGALKALINSFLDMCIQDIGGFVEGCKIISLADDIGNRAKMGREFVLIFY